MSSKSSPDTLELRDVLRALVERTDEALAYLDPSFRFVHVNAAYVAATGRPARELVGAGIFEVFRDPEGQEVFERARDTGEPTSWHERPWVFADQPERGTTYWTWTLTPDRDDGALRGFVMSMRDVTGQVTARERLRAQAERLRLALDVARMATWEWNLVTGEVDWSEANYRMLGYEPGEVTPSYERWIDRIHPDDRAATEQGVAAAVARGTDYSADFRVRWPDGRVRWHEARARMAKGREGRPVRQYGVVTDITERKQTEEMLRAEGEKKSEFLAALSHELRNPLAPISSSLYVLEHVAPGSPEAQKAHAVIGRQVAQLSRLVDDLLDLTRIARNKVRVELGDVPLAKLLSEVCDDHRAVFARAGVALEVAAPAEDVAVRGDAQRLAQVVGNLLQNAVKFTPRGGHASVRASVDGDAAVIQVRDDGVGMTADTLARVFEPFTQAEISIDRSRGGLGLGLALARGLVELHGGSVAAHSAGRGRGTEITVRLPLAAARSASQLVPRAEGRARRILVIEDNLDSAEMLATALGIARHEVQVTHDGVAGLASAREHHPEVVLCDLGLPGLDGYEVARALRADEAFDDVFLIALSGYAQPADQARSHEAGFDAHLAKPARIGDLEAMLRALPEKNTRGAA